MDKETCALAAIIDSIRADWSSPRAAMHPQGECPFLLRSTFVQNSFSTRREGLFPNTPEQLLSFWKLYASASLFKDERFGQWGIELLGAEDAYVQTVRLAHERPLESREGDVVFGRFLGDSELLVMEMHGAVLVCMPLDERRGWPKVAGSLWQFLSRLFHAQGAKYWEG